MNKPKTALVVAPYFFPKIGGLENYAYNVAKCLHINGEYKVVIVTSDYKGKGYSRSEIDGMTIYRLPVWLKISNTPINPMWYWWFKRIFKEERPAIINLHAPVPFMADIAVRAFNRDVPIVLTYHSGSMLKNQFGVDIVIYLYEKIFLPFFFKRVDSIVAVSKSFFENKIGKNYKFKTRLIRPGVDTSVFKPKSSSSSSKVVTYVGRIEHSSSMKGIEELLQAMALVIRKCPDAKLEIIGGGDALEHYRDRSEELGISKSVTMCGVKMGQDLVDAYQRSSVVVLPTTTATEQSSIVLIEAMATGTPVVATNIGGTPLIIEHKKNGLLVEPKDVEALATGIESVLTNHSLAEQLADEGLVSAKKVDWGVQIKKYQELFKSLQHKSQPIAYVVGYYPPHVGGMENVAREISIELSKLCYSVTVFTSNIGSKKNKKNGNKNDINYRVKRLFTSYLANTPIMWTLPLRLLCLPRGSILHVHLAQAGIPEIACLVAKIRRFPLVVHFHADVEPSGLMGKLLPLYKKYILNYVLQCTDKIIVLNEVHAKFVREKYNIKESNIIVVPNGVSGEYFCRKKRSFSKKPLQLLFVGRLCAQKHVNRLVEAVSLLKFSVRLTIVGDGEERQKLVDLSKKLNLNNVEFTGNKFGKELQAYYKNADVFVMSSNSESGPLAALEAMASGLPIVGSNVVGTHELVGGVGVLVDDPCGKTFAVALTKLLADTEQLKKLSTQSIKKAEQFTWDKLTVRLENIYKSLKS